MRIDQKSFFKLQVVLIFCFLYLHPRSGFSDVNVQIDWPDFMSRHDMIWKQLPVNWTQAPWFGNGLVGSIIYKDGDNNRFKMQVFRSDVQEHRPFTQGHSGYTRYRMQIGSFYFQPKGEITGCDWRLDLYNAQLIGTIETTKGEIKIKHFVHANDLILYTELTTTGDEACTWTWEAADTQPTRPGYPATEQKLPRVRKRYHSQYPTEVFDANPAPVLSRQGNIHVCLQRLTHGGEHATAWTLKTQGNAQVHIASIAKSWPKEVQMADKQAMDAVDKVAQLANREQWKQEHYNWWHHYYPQSFVSLSDTRIETDYWTQMYKLASTTRAEYPVMDTPGLWPCRQNGRLSPGI